MGPMASVGRRRSHPRSLPSRLVVLSLGVVVLPALSACAGKASAEGPHHVSVQVRIHYSAFEPGQLTFTRGTTVTFVIHNTDPIDHEFIVGDQAVQDFIENTAHPAHDGSVQGQISIPAGQTRETTYTFRKVTTFDGELQFACHLAGHYAYGMHGPITVTA